MSKIEIREFEININSESIVRTLGSTPIASGLGSIFGTLGINIPIASHQFLAKFNSEANIVGEFHGFAIDPSTGERKPVGTWSDKLKAYEFPTRDGNFSGLYREGQPSKTLIFGNDIIIDKRWEAAHNAVEALKNRTINYAPLDCNDDPTDFRSGNSNSIARTLVEVMGFQYESFSGRWVPGSEKNLLPRSQYAYLYCDTWITDEAEVTGALAGLDNALSDV